MELVIDFVGGRERCFGIVRLRVDFVGLVVVEAQGP